MSLNVMAPHGIFKNTWERPGSAWVGTWLWDNAFHSKIWSLSNLDYAAYVLESHMKFQDKENPNDEYNYGRIPHSIEGNKVNSWTQPPLMAWAFWELFKKNGSIDMLARYFSDLFAYHLWLNFNRDLNKDGLYSWLHGFESGIDNAPRYDSISPLECNAVDFSSCVSVQLRSLIHMATVLKDIPTRDGLLERKKELDDWINEDLWDEETAFFYDKAFAGKHEGEFIGPKMISGWYPLFAGIVPRHRLGRYLSHLTDSSEFWTPFPVATVARDEESFDEEMNMWRGPTWINTNYIIIKGLKGYGFRALPGELAYLTVKHLFDVYNEKEIYYEYYSSLGNNDGIETFSRKKEKNGPRPYFGWTCLVANILVEEMLGIEVQHDAILLVPSVPDAFINVLQEGVVKGTLPKVNGWNQGNIEFTIDFKPGNIINYRFNLDMPMDIHVVDFDTKESIFTGDYLNMIDIDIENNKDVVSILSKPDGLVSKEEFQVEDG
ncbi:hypothetical protein GF325_08410 [Candidatus Bathyarchaeota archaeon]|nr:hypothetical protein [Candidatus Bathyarchaeota archaeon]